MTLGRAWQEQIKELRSENVRLQAAKRAALKVADERSKENVKLRAALAAERERCARHIDLIAADWREVGADQKIWASEYLACQIRELDAVEQTGDGK